MVPEGYLELVKKIFRKTLILVFDVNVQPPKYTFEIFFLRFSSLCLYFRPDSSLQLVLSKNYSILARLKAASGGSLGCVSEVKWRVNT